MTWGNRLRLVVGLVAVLAVAAVATDHLNSDRGRAESTNAEISAEHYTVGTPYAGKILAQPAAVGDEVAAGDPLFVIESAQLKRDVVDGIVDARAATGDVDADENLIIRATEAGVLTETSAAAGAFVQAATDLASVQRVGSLHVLAEFRMTTSEYGRLENSAPVTLHLPDGRELTGSTDEIQVERDGEGGSIVILKIASDELQRLAQDDRLVTTGTPLAADVRPRNEAG